MCQVDATPHTWCRPAASERRRSPCALAWARLLSLGGVDRARPTLCLRCNVRRGSDPQMLLHFAWPALLEGVPRGRRVLPRERDGRLAAAPTISNVDGDHARY